MWFKVENDAQKVPKQAEAKRDGVINPKITLSINFNSEIFDSLKILRIDRSSSNDTQQVQCSQYIKRDFFQDVFKILNWILALSVNSNRDFY